MSTDVGKISLGVEIHGDDLSAKLGEAVRKAIAPALAEIQRELQKTQREYNETGRAAEKSAMKQVDAAHVAADAVKQVGQNAEKSAAKTQIASGVSARAIRDVTRAIQEQTAAWNANTAARAANAAAPTGGPPRRGGGGGGSDSYGGGGYGGGRRGGVLGFLTGPTGLNAIALGAQAMPALATGIINVVGAVQQLAQAGAVLPGIFGGGAAVIGTAVLGLHGIKDAVKALNEAAGDPKKLEKANKELEKMAPNAVAVAKSISQFTQGPGRDFQKAISQTMLDGVAGDLDNFQKKVLPAVEPGMQKVAKALNGTIKTGLNELSSDKSLNFLDQIFGNTAEAERRADKAVKPILSAFGQLTTTGTQLLPRLADGLTGVSNRFDQFISKNANNGNLFKWIDQGITSMTQLGNATLNLGKLITGLTSAAGGGNSFLNGLVTMTDKWQAFVNSTEGQSKLGDFFAQGRDDLHQWSELLKTLWPVLKSVIGGFAEWGKVTLPIISALAGIVNWLNQIPGLVKAVVVGFLAWRTISAIVQGITGRLGGMTAATTAAGTAASGGAGAAGGAIGTKFQKGVAGLGLLATGAAVQGTANKDDVGGQAIGALETIGGGALAGSAFGPWGALIGGGIGAAIAGINYLTAENADETQKAAMSQEQWAAAIEKSNAAHDAQLAAIKGANDALTASGGVIDQTTLNNVAEQVNQVPKLLSGFHSDDVVAQVAKDMQSLGQTADQTAKIVTGSQQDFDALTARLVAMGPAGDLAAKTLAEIRENTLGAATNATTAAPLLQNLTKDGGDVTDTLVRVQNAFAAIPTDVPLNIHQQGAQAVEDILKQLGAQVQENTDGTINVTAPLAPEVLQQLEAIGVQIKQNADGTINVEIPGFGQVMDQLAQLDQATNALLSKDYNLNITVPAAGPQVQAPSSLYQGDTGGMTIGGRANGGGIWGGIPGVDSVPILAQQGEYVLDTGDVARLGGFAGVDRLRSRLKGYADGGPVGAVGVDDGTELGVLRQIRDLLAGKGGTTNNPLAATAANTAHTSKALGVGAGGKASGGIGPFGTPLKPRGDPAYEMAAAAIQALGGDPEKFLGTDPTLAALGAGGLGGGGAVMGGANRSALAAALAKFATSGNLGDLAGLGLDASTPVVSAITSARNRKKNGLSDDAISGLVSQIIGGGGYSGTLDPINTPLIRGLQRFSDQLNKTGGGYAPVAGATGVPMSALGGPVTGSGQALINFAQQANGGQYAAASDLTNGLADCSGAVSDLVEFLTRGQAGPDRLFTTTNEGQVLMGLGATKGFVPGNLNIGVSPTHTAATLPNGVNFESGGSGGGVVYGGPVGALDKQFTDVYSLPTDMMGRVGMTGFGMGGLGSGMGGGNRLGYSGGGPVPVYIVNGPGGIGGPGGIFGPGSPAGPVASNILGAGLSAAGQAASGVAGDVVHGVNTALDGLIPIGYSKGAASTEDLVKQRNPLALASMAGFNVPDYTRQGGENKPLEQNDQKYTANGDVMSDTSALVERTFTDMNAQLRAQFDQLVSVMNQVRDMLSDKALTPILQNAIQSGIGELKESVLNGLGTSIGNAAAPPIAAAVKEAVASIQPAPSSGGGGGDPTGGIADSISQAGGSIIGNLFASGGAVSGGIPGKDSVPILAQQGEWVLNTSDVAKLGGTAGVGKFVHGLRTGRIRGYASGGDVNNKANATVGADFFGVSQIPILGAIVNLLINVLLSVLGVEIKVRDTMTNLSSEVRQFRGDAFKAFDAQGRLISDTSALLDRSSTSEQTAADERVRILKIVIQALIKYVIEKIIVPITKAVANAAIQAGAAAAGAAINSQAPGAGGIVSSLISSSGQAGVEIVGDIAGEFASSFWQVAVSGIFEAIQTTFPDLVTSVFGGGWIQALLAPFLLMATGATVAGPNGSFDSGGMATGVGWMPKATLAPERVLNPGQTLLFDRMVSALERGKSSTGDTRMVNAEIHMHGSNATPEAVAGRITSLLS